MATPVINTAVLNKTNFVSGEQGTVTVTYSDADNFTEVRHLTVKVTDEAGNSGTVDLPFNVKHVDNLTVTVVDSDPTKIWAQQSNASGTAVHACAAV